MSKKNFRDTAVPYPVHWDIRTHNLSEDDMLLVLRMAEK